MKSAETHPTPPNVVQAIATVAAWLRTIDAAECRIAPTGDATFALEAHTTQVERLYQHITDLTNDHAGLEALDHEAQEGANELTAENTRLREALRTLVHTSDRYTMADAACSRWNEQTDIYNPRLANEFADAVAALSAALRTARELLKVEAI